MRVILGHNDGISIGDLAKTLRLSRATVTSYLNDFDSQQKSKNDPRGGTCPKLTSEQSKTLSDHLDKTTYLNVKFICEYIQKQFGVIYSRSGMTAWLQAHKFVFNRPKKIPAKLVPQQKEKFIEEYERLKSYLQPDEEIFFIDAVHPEHQSQAICGWIRRGVQKKLQTTGKQLRMHFAGLFA